MSNNKLIDSIYSCDYSVLTPDILEQLLKVIPNAKEQKIYAACKEPNSKLDKPDRFMKQIIVIPGLTFRVTAMVFKLNMENDLQDIEDQIDSQQVIFNSLMKTRPYCENLKKILLHILAYGNYLNGTNKRLGGQWGFEVSTLQKVSQYKGNDKETSLLQFIITDLLKEDWNIIDHEEDLTEWKLAARVPVKQLGIDFNIMKGKAKSV